MVASTFFVYYFTDYRIPQAIRASFPAYDIGLVPNQEASSLEARAT